MSFPLLHAKNHNIIGDEEDSMLCMSMSSDDEHEQHHILMIMSHQQQQKQQYHEGRMGHKDSRLLTSGSHSPTSIVERRSIGDIPAVREVPSILLCNEYHDSIMLPMMTCKASSTSTSPTNSNTMMMSRPRRYASPTTVLYSPTSAPQDILKKRYRQQYLAEMCSSM